MRGSAEFSRAVQAPIALAAGIAILMGVSGCDTDTAVAGATSTEIRAFDALPKGPCADFNDAVREGVEPKIKDAKKCIKYGHSALTIHVVDFAGEDPADIGAFATNLRDFLHDYSQGAVEATVVTEKPTDQAREAFANTVALTGDSGCTDSHNAMRFASAAVLAQGGIPKDTIVVALNPTPACGTTNKSRVAGTSNIANGAIADVFTAYTSSTSNEIKTLLRTDAQVAAHEVFHLIGDLEHANTLTQASDTGTVAEIENGGEIDLGLFPTGKPVFYEYGDQSNIMGSSGFSGYEFMPLSAYQINQLQRPEQIVGEPTIADLASLTAEGVELSAENAYTSAAVFNFGKYFKIDAQDVNGASVDVNYNQLVFAVVRDAQDNALGTSVYLGDSVTAETTHIATIANTIPGQAGNTTLVLNGARIILQFNEDGKVSLWDVTQS